MLKFYRTLSIVSVVALGFFVQRACSSTLESVETSGGGILLAKLDADIRDMFEVQNALTHPVSTFVVSEKITGSQPPVHSEPFERSLPETNYHWEEPTQSFDIAGLFQLDLDPSGPMAMVMMFASMALVGLVVGSIRLEVLRRRALPVYSRSSRRRHRRHTHPTVCSGSGPNRRSNRHLSRRRWLSGSWSLRLSTTHPVTVEGRLAI